MSATTRPVWADPTLGWVDRDERLDPEDHGEGFESQPLARWEPVTPDSEGEVKVWLEEHHYDARPEDNWATVNVDGVALGGQVSVSLFPADARRLAAALVAACDLVEADHKHLIQVEDLADWLAALPDSR